MPGATQRPIAQRKGRRPLYPPCKAPHADFLGPPPANSYIDSISLPLHRGELCNAFAATLTFTPLIAGYRQVSASCGVTVADTKTNQYWTGSANAGPRYLTDCTLGSNFLSLELADA